MRATAQQLGVSVEALQAALPELSPLARTAMLCWNFCEGWAPERWPMFNAFHQVSDWAGLVELLQAMRRAQLGGDDEA